jgi:RNA polymerase sigma-70 factor, ECF subfamily
VRIFDLPGQYCVIPVSTPQTPNPASATPAERWLADHGDALYRFALQRLRNPETAEDLVQETLLAALAAKAGFAGRSAERTWLIGILKHKLVDQIRKSLRQGPLPELQAEDDLGLFDNRGRWKVRVSRWNCDPHEALENAEFRAVLVSCLSKLPPRIAQVFWLHEAESVSSKELCKELEISPTNVWTMLHRARLRLQRCLSLNWFERDDR